MSDIANFIDDHDFIVTMARFADGLETRAAVKKRFNFSDEIWESLGSNDRLVEAISRESARRLADGSTARERAQVLYAEVPPVLGEILKKSASDRNRIESARELRAISSVGPEATTASERFVISIILNGDVETYNKSRAIDVNDINPDDPDSAPQKLVAIVAADKPTDGGNGNAL
jgi:hypothetical protein